MFVVRPNPRDPSKHDVVRMEPTVVSEALKPVEAEALAFALNAQVKHLEGKK